MRKMRKYLPVLLSILICMNSFSSFGEFTKKGSSHGIAIPRMLTISEANSLYNKLIKLPTIEQQFALLKEYGFIPQNVTLSGTVLYKGPYLFSMVYEGFAFPPIPLTLAMIWYGYIFHLFPMTIIFLNLIFKLLNIATPPPLPEISTGYIFAGDISPYGKYKLEVKTPIYNDSKEGTRGIELACFGFIGWKIYIPIKIFTGFWVIFGKIPIPLPYSLAIIIGASPYLLYRCY